MAKKYEIKETNPPPPLLTSRMFKDHTYKIYGVLIVATLCIVGFQNCRLQDMGAITSPSDNSNTKNNISLLSEGNSAIFALYGAAPHTVNSVLWEVRKRDPETLEEQVHTRKTTSKSKFSINWKNILSQNIHQAGAFVTLSGQDCIAYRSIQIPEQLVITSIDEPGSGGGTSRSSITTISTSTTLPTTGTSRPFGIQAASSEDSNVFKDYFPVNSTVYFSATEGLSGYSWSIEQIFDTTGGIGEASVPGNTNNTFSYTFNTRGFYEVNVTATDSDGSKASHKMPLLIGLCEDEEAAVELVVDAQSFGESTPELIKQIPVLNYIRPYDNAKNPVKLKMERRPLSVASSPSPSDATTSTHYSFYGVFYDTHRPLYYKYNRKSSTKFIALDALNMTECFFDDEPDESGFPCPRISEGSYEQRTCKSYTRRSDLEPLPSCRGTAYDMGEIDTDTTQCTEDIFVVDATPIDLSWQPDLFLPLGPYYKYCQAKSEFCYFGKLSRRSKEHHCPEDGAVGTR